MSRIMAAIIVFFVVFYQPQASASESHFPLLTRDQNLHLDSLPVRKTLQTVLFATNNDCNLSIYGEYNGSVSKAEHLRIQLVPGVYTFKAISKTGAEELEKSFTVREGQPNEVFIDLLYLANQSLVQKNEKKEVQKPVPPNKKTVIEQEPNIRISSDPGVVIANMVENMVAINGGSFIMGNNKAPSEDEREHTVTIKSVLFSMYEVTQGQWQTVMGNNPSVNKGCNACPVENVSWEEVMEFIKKLNELSNKKFRLPTEAEWEYVARFGGKDEIEQFGGPEEFIKATAWYFANADKKTHPVGQLRANAAGIYDLFGNVSEWCADWYGAEYFKAENQKNPVGPSAGKEKVVRGGSYIEYSADRFRPSLRKRLSPGTKTKEVGFRLVTDMN